MQLEEATVQTGSVMWAGGFARRSVAAQNGFGEPGRRPGAVIVQEDDHGLHAGHVMVDGDDVDAVGAQRLQHRRHLVLQHGDIAGHHRVLVSAGKGIHGDKG
jgi:hypothetical protein